MIQFIPCHISFLPRSMECRRGSAMTILSVRPSVCPFVCQMCGMWQNEIKISQDFHTIGKIIYPSFLRERMVGRGRPLLPEILGQHPRWSEIADFEQIIARRASAVTPSEKSSINTNRKSTTRFPMSLRWSSYVAPKTSKGELKRAKRPFF